ncbi:MAG: UDP-N-acetylglucosamine--N-acetylmuramyl-(pentapeptide) pyrophosphoryl-undecaprenol N-acetylglucosamine transferase [Patescibacteria group bacterium]|nr:UDP-N-acetylglucosamine--N-acetylmuramyl-(pentapeptide) pyrophosphoryl-undecaprenol N-acetylglucosamine transferase [Patescibacteria group bacterium]MCL5095110.1 UDP-N-acetylglucosamine--N-acetylmuramyl-(pentapeptide) pyrophosphoryl-undecaprenol N-acetylglucosamine transferase [Patescibacteria group bacterium]
MSSTKKIIITGGHLTPALSVLPKLRENGWQIIFLGRKYALEGDKTLSTEYRVIKELGIDFVSLTTGRLQRNFSRYTLSSLLKIPLGLIQSFYYLRKYKPNLILSFGGYLALPVAFAGWFLRIPIVTHEQSAVSGLANDLIAKVADKICLSWEKTTTGLPAGKVVYTGNPLRKEIFTPTADNFQNLFNEKLPLVYITGGNLGAHVLNEAMIAILPKLLEKYQIIHQCGETKTYEDYEKLLSFVSSLPPHLQKRYVLKKYIDVKDVGWVLNRADWVISRSGANIVTELAALGKPAILIPLPWAGQNEQLENARLLEKAGTAVIFPQKDLKTENFYKAIELFSKNLDNYRINARAAQKIINFNAADKLVDVVEEVFHAS